MSIWTISFLLPKHGGHCTYPRDALPFYGHFCSALLLQQKTFLNKPIPANIVLKKNLSTCCLSQTSFRRPRDRSTPAHPEPITQLQVMPWCWLTGYTNQPWWKHHKGFWFTTRKLDSCHALHNQDVCYVLGGIFCPALSSDTLFFERQPGYRVILASWNGLGSLQTTRVIKHFKRP